LTLILGVHPSGKGEEPFCYLDSFLLSSSAKIQSSLKHGHMLKG